MQYNISTIQLRVLMLSVSKNDISCTCAIICAICNLSPHRAAFTLQLVFTPAFWAKEIGYLFVIRKCSILSLLQRGQYILSLIHASVSTRAICDLLLYFAASSLFKYKSISIHSIFCNRTLLWRQLAATIAQIFRLPYSHSIVPGGLLVISYTTRLTSCTSAMMRLAIFLSTG